MFHATLTVVRRPVAGCLTSQQHARVYQGRVRSDKFTCCHTETEVADQTSYLTQSQYTDIGPTSPSPDPITPGAWQGSHWSANFQVIGMTRPGTTRRKLESNPRCSTLEADTLTTAVCLGHWFAVWCFFFFFSFLFFCVPQLYLWGSLFWMRFLRMWLFLIQTSR